MAQATEKVVDAAGKMTGTGSENLVYELLGKRMSFPIRLYTRLNQFLARRRAQKQGTIRQYDALVRARDNLKAAIAQAGKWQKGMGGQDATLELDERNRASGKIRTGTEQTQMQLAIEYDRNNRPFVVVEEDILEGVPKEEWIDKVKETMAQKFPEGIRVGNNIIRISRKTRKEWTRSKNSSWLRYNDADAYADKMLSLIHI